MVLIKKFLSSQNSLIKIFISISFVISFLSVGTSIYNLQMIGLFNSDNSNLALSEISSGQFVNSIRALLNISIFPILSLLYLGILIKDKTENFHSNLIFFIPLFYFLSQIPGLFYTTNYVGNILYSISALNILMVTILMFKYFNTKEILFIPYVTFVIMLCILFFIFVGDLYTYFESGIRFYGRISDINDGTSIRSSGLSRMALLLLLIYLILLSNFIKSKLWRQIPPIAFILIIYLYQSRTSMILVGVFLIIDLLINRKNLFRNVLYAFIPLIIYLSLPFVVTFTKPIYVKTAIELGTILEDNKLKFYTNANTNTNTNTDEIITSENQDDTPKSAEKFRVGVGRLFAGNSIYSSSGRLDDWKNIFNRYDFSNHLFFGYGSQGDRFLINQTASNGFIYAFASTGLIGLTFFLLFSLSSLVNIYRYFFIYKKRSQIEYYATTVVLLIGIRSLVESSYALFGIDLIFFYTCSILIARNNLNKTK